MDNKVLRKLFLGFIQIHILHHAKEEAIYGSWMLEELHEHGYEMSAGTLYPILHNMGRDQLLIREDVNINGKIRKYYRITERGDHV
ncbi:MAG TPA: PadR family transcriptional regulator, partial [Pseudogracilibacillus sp.]|nr:PadR family transcriptional regulator [Pseudogracilibacillus sp.]